MVLVTQNQLPESAVGSQLSAAFAVLSHRVRHAAADTGSPEGVHVFGHSSTPSLTVLMPSRRSSS